MTASKLNASEAARLRELREAMQPLREEIDEIQTELKALKLQLAPLKQEILERRASKAE